MSAERFFPPSDPCGKPLFPSQIEIYDPPSYSHKVQAYSWRSLTSGSAKTALWVLLLPYMLANVAGWAMVPLQSHPPSVPTKGKSREDRRNYAVRVSALLVRLAGLIVTSFFVLFTLLATADLIGYQFLQQDFTWMPRISGWVAQHFPCLTSHLQCINRDRGIGAGIALTATAVTLIFRFTRLRIRPDGLFQNPWDDHLDPAG